MYRVYTGVHLYNRDLGSVAFVARGDLLQG